MTHKHTSLIFVTLRKSSSPGGTKTSKERSRVSKKRNSSSARERKDKQEEEHQLQNKGISKGKEIDWVVA